MNEKNQITMAYRMKYLALGIVLFGVLPYVWAVWKNQTKSK